MKTSYLITALLLITSGAAWGQNQPSSIRPENDKYWMKAYKFFEGESARQNNGKPLMVRKCFPATTATCSNRLLTLKIETNEIVMLETVVNAYDIPIARWICTSNSSQDIVNCRNFDSGFISMQMKDTNGDWQPIDPGQ